MSSERSPDMIWYDCEDCDHQHTLADVTDDGECPWCAREEEND